MKKTLLRNKKFSVTTYNMYVWENCEEREENGEKYNLLLDEMITTDEDACKKLTEQYQGSEYYQIDKESDIAIFNEDEYNLELVDNKIIRCNGKLYKYIGAYRDENDEFNYGFIKLEQLKHYKYKCVKCGELIHEDNYQFQVTNEEEIYCSECAEEELFYCEICGEWYKIDGKLDHHILSNDDYSNFTTICDNCKNKIDDFLKSVKKTYSNKVYNEVKNVLYNYSLDSAKDTLKEITNKVIMTVA